MSQGPADLLVVGGTIHTGDEGAPRANAVAVCGRRFAYVGSASGAMALRGPHTHVLDVSGRTVLPGLVDAHLHLTGLGLRLHQVNLDGSESLDDLLQRTLDFAQDSSGDGLIGGGWD
jgi:predicted amidohydrolase YtcJ